MFFWWLLSGAVFVVCFLQFRKVRVMNREFEKFEFESRNSAGLLQFNSFEDSKAYERKKNRAGLRAFPVLFGLVAGGIVFGVTTLDYLEPNFFRLRCNSEPSCEKHKLL